MPLSCWPELTNLACQRDAPHILCILRATCKATPLGCCASKSLHVGVASSHHGNLGCALKPLACAPCVVFSAATVVRSAPSYGLVLHTASAVEHMSAATVVLSPAFLAHNSSVQGATHFVSSLSLTFSACPSHSVHVPKRTID